jgi:hypothetical protein
MGTMVAKTVVDAKGDLIAGTAADTVNRLAVGNDGETLVADSSTSTGLRYTAGTVQSNPVLNSAMQVWQRGTSLSFTTSTTGYTADRWQARITATCNTTYSRQLTNDTTNLPNIQYCARVQRNNGQTATPYIVLEQSFETINSIPYAGKTVTFSFYARKGANFSSPSSDITVTFQSGTGTDQNIASGYVGVVNIVNQPQVLTTTWQRFTYTGIVPTNSTELGMTFYYLASGTAGAADYFEITGVQIDIGSVALPFRTYAGTIQGELAACQRYYQRHTEGMAVGVVQNTTTGTRLTTTFPVAMRTAPTVSQTGMGLWDGTQATNITSLAANRATTTILQIDAGATGGGLTVGRAVVAYNTGSGYWELSSEL